LSLAPGRQLPARLAGVFLFLPLLARLRFDQLVERAGYPGSKMVSASSALLSLLALKLLDKERHSRYAGRNRVEDGLGIRVNFFHLDCLASEVRLNVDLDATLTVLANGCYRWLASRLRGYEKAAPKQLYRRFVETSGRVEIQEDRIVVHFDKRSHNPILREAALDREQIPIPWLNDLPVLFTFP